MTRSDAIGLAWSAKIVVAGPHAILFEPVFAGLSEVVSLFEDPDDHDNENAVWFVEGLFAAAPPRAELAARIALVAQAAGLAEPALTIARVPSKDWLTENVASFKPLTAGRYYVHGDHVPGPYPPGKVRLRVNAATAFGSGEHASTYGCLLALDGLARRRATATILAGSGRMAALDMGCGSGILALAMAMTWPVSVLAADIDPEAVRVTRFNGHANGASARLRAVLADGCGAASIRRNGPYGLITANILARPLRHMARDLSRLLAPGGHLILAGLLQRQEPMVLTAYRSQGLRLARRIALKPWSILVMRR
ncbi:MAG: 50S ribosomal protein L11 methyltransferase [Rhodospirillaceae bacterium]|nr:MAG: 50S ribosomal protein L11 methyltransferase [Rhodospirillaceae bacterium]